MGENSKIEWTTHTFNPWMGCQKVSPGCDHCYAEAMMDHRYHRLQWGPHGERKRTSRENWRKPIKWAKDANGHRPRQPGTSSPPVRHQSASDAQKTPRGKFRGWCRDATILTKGKRRPATN
jgi:hypothetical protein